MILKLCNEVVHENEPWHFIFVEIILDGLCNLSKLLLYFYHRILKRRTPYTLISWRFFVPFGLADLDSEAYKLHKYVFQNAWKQLPRWLYALGVIYSLIVWYAVWGPWHYGKHLYRRTYSNQGENDLQNIATSHYLKQAFFAYLRGMSTLSFRALKFAEIPRSDWWEYVPNQLLPHWHLVLQKKYGDRASKIISNKRVFAEVMGNAGLAVVATHVLTGIEDFDLNGDWFFKPEVSSQAKGCLILESTGDDTVRLRSKDGELELTKTDAIQAYLKRSACAKPYLVQPRLFSHAELTKFYDNNDLAVVRIVTLRSTQGFTVWRANIELPMKNKVFIKPYAINVDTGRVSGLDNLMLPHWRALMDLVIKAHTEVAELNTVGWDVAITDDGPVLLEGNLNWGTVTLQDDERGGMVDSPYLNMVRESGLRDLIL